MKKNEDQSYFHYYNTYNDIPDEIRNDENCLLKQTMFAD